MAKRALAIALPIVITAVSGAQAAEVKLLSAAVMKPMLTELSGEFERTTGHKLTVSYESAGTVKNRVQGGERVDVAIIQKPTLDTLANEGKIAAGSVKTLARSCVALAVPKGAQKPDIGSADALKRTLLAAESVTYPDPKMGHASGIHFRGVLDRLGIAAEIDTKAKLQSGTFSEFAAHDNAAIGITQPAEILAVSSYDLVGCLPAALQDYDRFTWAAGMTANAKEPGAADALLRFLSSPAAAAVIKARGMEPG